MSDLATLARNLSLFLGVHGCKTSWTFFFPSLHRVPFRSPPLESLSTRDELTGPRGAGGMIGINPLGYRCLRYLREPIEHI